MIDEKNSDKESFVPKLERDRCMHKKCKSHLNNMAMLALDGAILLVSVWAGNMMGYTYAFEGVQGLILPSPIGLNNMNFAIKLSFNKILKIMKTLKNFRLMTQKVDPSELAIIINKTDIIIMSPNRGWSGPPHI
jgi:hypothetical protein